MKSINIDLLNDKIKSSLSNVPEDNLNKVKNFILTANDYELANINTNKIADMLSIDKISLMKTFLHLTKEGVFNLLWSVHCPACKGVNQLSSSLNFIKHASECDLCEIDYQAGFDKNLQLSFEISPNIAKLDDLDHFNIMFAGIYLEPGISINLEVNEKHYLEIDVKEGNYALFNVTDRKGCNFIVRNGDINKEQEYTFDYKNNMPRIIAEEVLEGKLKLTIINSSDKESEFVFSKLKKSEWSDASFITSLQEFRDMFSNEVLSVNESFSIQNLSFIFTDIKGSTEMYEKLGDSKAFFLIKEHFKILQEVVKRNNGGIVKTIGDAIMAVFTVNENALKASYEMIEAFDLFNKENNIVNNIFIKVGIHNGSCIAVNLNDKIDYFGTSVNMAARIQGLSDGREIMISEKFFNDSFAKKFLEEKKWDVESFVTSLKGLKDTYTIYKLIKK
jgi:adenylate cyclase